MSILDRLRMWAGIRTTQSPHYWFQDDDGTYYRNGPLVLDEMKEALINPKLFDALQNELHEIWRKGVTSKAVLDPGDVVVERVPFSVSHPHMPELSRLLDNRDKP